MRSGGPGYSRLHISSARKMTGHHTAAGLHLFWVKVRGEASLVTEFGAGCRGQPGHTADSHVCHHTTGFETIRQHLLGDLHTHDIYKPPVRQQPEHLIGSTAHNTSNTSIKYYYSVVGMYAIGASRPWTLEAPGGVGRRCRWCTQWTSSCHSE